MHICYLMKNGSSAQATLLFRTLSDPTRLRLLNLIADREVCVCDLTDTLKIVQPRVSRHLAHLKRAGLVEARRDGKWMHYRWAEQGNSLVRNVLLGLRDWMTKENEMNRERDKLQSVCCSSDKARAIRTKRGSRK